MADMLKPKLQLRSVASFSAADKSPSPGSRLMLNHGKPNFTIQRTNKTQMWSTQAQNVNNNVKTNVVNNNVSQNRQFIVKNSKPNGIVKPTPTSLSIRPIQNGSSNEASKVILRRTKMTENSVGKQVEDDEPEFIKAQRRIQERLAKENILDFDKRKSGYFTHVMMSPTSPKSKSTFGETMESPAPVSALEFPVPKSVSSVTSNLVSEEKLVIISEEHPKNKISSIEINIADAVLLPAKESLENNVLLAVNGVLDEQNLPTEEAKHTYIHDEDLLKISEVPTNHTNGYSSEYPKIPESGNKGINFEPPTVVSFSKDLSSELNKYPDTVKTVTDVKSSIPVDEELQELVKLKFDIKTDEEDVKVIPVLRAE